MPPYSFFRRIRTTSWESRSFFLSSFVILSTLLEACNKSCSERVYWILHWSYGWYFKTFRTHGQVLVLELMTRRKSFDCMKSLWMRIFWLIQVGPPIWNASRETGIEKLTPFQHRCAQPTNPSSQILGSQVPIWVIYWWYRHLSSHNYGWERPRMSSVRWTN